MSSITDIRLAPEGEKKINWVARNMPICNAIAADFAKTRPFEGLKITLSVHLEAKTADLCRVLFPLPPAPGGGGLRLWTGSD